MKIIQSSKESTMKRKLFAVIGILAMLVCLLSAPVFSASPASLPDNCTPAAGVVIQPLYSNGYVACALGTLKGLPAAIGAITFKDGDPNTLLVATYTETSPAAIYSVPVHRDADNHILDFSNSGTYFASAPYVSTGMAYGPENLLFYSRWPVNELGEIKPGSALTDKIIGLSALGVTPSVSGMNFVPDDFSNAGELRLVTKQTSDWYAATLSLESDGTYSIATITKKTRISSYPEGFVYVPPASSPFPDHSAMLVGEYYNGAISAYSLDSESNPVPTSRNVFLTGLPWVKGSAFDPVTGDLIVATRGGRLTAVRGFGTQPWVPTPTPTATVTPPKTYTISGRVTTSNGGGVDDVYIYVDGVWGARTSNGYYYLTGLTAGTYHITTYKWAFSIQPSEKIVTVPPDGTANFTAQQLISHSPVILVHGYLGMSGITDKCAYGVEHYGEKEDKARFFDDLPKWLIEDGFDVWVAHWDSAPFPDTTAPIEVDGQCLADQIAEVKQRTKADRVILIAHSMGGPVSRAYLQSDAYKLRRDVETLITLGSPHGGINGLPVVAATGIGAIALTAYCIAQPAFCEMEPAYMWLFNNRWEQNSTDYTFIGADGGGGPLGLVLWPLNGPNDGLVSLASGTGKYFSWLGNSDALRHPLARYQTHEDHIREWGTWYFEPRQNYIRSDSYMCVREILLSLNRADCPVAPQPPAKAQEQGSQSALAPIQSGHISTGETISHTLSIDTADRSIFALTWVTQTLSLTLVDPDGVTIDPTYAMSNPSIVTFDSGPAGNGSPGWMTYAFTNTVPGAWTLGVSAPYAGAGGTDWTAISGFASDRTLEVGIGSGFYQIGDTATLTATLNSGTAGITGATVSVDMARSDGVVDTLALTDMGGGQYQGTYTIPNAPGFVEATFTANGNDGGTAFARQYSQLLSIMPQTGKLTGSYADRAADENGDSWADALEVDVGIDISIAGDYNLTADLQAGGQVVAQSSKVISATAGSQTVTLRFDGSDIYNAGLDGPYTLTNLVLVDLQPAVPTIMQSDLYTTAAYKYAQFMPGSTLYLPMITR
jgi:pimeloyl-ACP methyl ester carboxylesterase